MKFCSNCGQQIDDNAKFCAHCGSAQAAQTPASQPTAPGGKRLHCPKCKSTHFSPVVETQTQGGFSMNMATGKKTGVSSIHLNSIHRDYWMCQSCGHKFRQIENLEAEAKDIGKRTTAFLVLLGIVLATTLLCLVTGSGELCMFSVPLAIIIGILYAYFKHQQKKLLAEQEYLSIHCFD